MSRQHQLFVMMHHPRKLSFLALGTLQEHFDCAVGTLRGVTGALRGQLMPVLRRAGGLAAEAAEAGQQGTAAAEALQEIR